MPYVWLNERKFNELSSFFKKNKKASLTYTSSAAPSSNTRFCPREPPGYLWPLSTGHMASPDGDALQRHTGFQRLGTKNKRIFHCLNVEVTTFWMFCVIKIYHFTHFFFPSSGGSLKVCKWFTFHLQWTALLYGNLS